MNSHECLIQSIQHCMWFYNLLECMYPSAELLACSALYSWCLMCLWFLMTCRMSNSYKKLLPSASTFPPYSSSELYFSSAGEGGGHVCKSVHKYCVMDTGLVTGLPKRHGAVEGVPRAQVLQCQYEARPTCDVSAAASHKALLAH